MEVGGLPERDTLAIPGMVLNSSLRVLNAIEHFGVQWQHHYLFTVITQFLILYVPHLLVDHESGDHQEKRKSQTGKRSVFCAASRRSYFCSKHL